MARVLITGSSDGLGAIAAGRLVSLGHEVVLHARNERRATDALARVPGARHVVIGDLSSIADTRDLAQQANAAGPFDAVIHNAGVGTNESRRETVDGLEHVFAINVLAPYILTALVAQPARLVYVSSGMHENGNPNLGDLQWRARGWNGSQAYSDSKLFDVVLAFAVARRWTNVRSNAIEPGWVPTKMGGPHAPDDLAEGADTQVWLAVSQEPSAAVSGCYFFHKQQRNAHRAASDVQVQERLLGACEALSGVRLPRQLA